MQNPVLECLAFRVVVAGEIDKDTPLRITKIECFAEECH